MDDLTHSAAGIGIVDTTSLAEASLALSGQTDHLRLRSPTEIESAVLDVNRPDRESFLCFLHNLMLYDELRTDFQVLDTHRAAHREPIHKLINRLSGELAISAMPPTISDAEVASLMLRSFLDTVIQNPTLHLGSAVFIGRSLAGHLALTAFGPAVFGEIRAFVTRHQELICQNHSLGDASIILVRQLSTIVRTMKYSAHSQFIHLRERIPSVYCAPPRRIDLIRNYVSHEQVQKLQKGASDFFGLFSRLGLPPVGYDFSICRPDIKPLAFSDLSLALRHLPAAAAFDRVLELRQTPEARELRRIWAERLWAGGDRALEGGHQSMENVNATGDVTQVIIGHVHMPGTGARDPGELIKQKDAADLRRHLTERLRAT